MAINILRKTLDWVSGATYQKYDIVKSNNFTYYALSSHSGRTDIPKNDTNFWGGRLIDPFGSTLSETNSIERPYFFFLPSYGVSTSVEPKVRLTKFGDGYEQRVQDGINSSLLKLNISFSSRTSMETAAILNFLKERGAVESFLFTPPEPYSLLRNFVCRSWVHTIVFFDNNDITTTFEQVPF